MSNEKSVSSYFLDEWRSNRHQPLEWKSTMAGGVGYNVSDLPPGITVKVQDPRTKARGIIVGTPIGNVSIRQSDVDPNYIVIDSPRKIADTEFSALRFLVWADRGGRANTGWDVVRITGADNFPNIGQQMQSLVRCVLGDTSKNAGIPNA